MIMRKLLALLLLFIGLLSADVRAQQSTSTKASRSFGEVEERRLLESKWKYTYAEFTQPNSKGTYQYHFIKVESKDAPFIKPANELPDVIVEMDEKKKKGGLFSFAKRKSKKKKRRKKKQKKYKDDRVYINIELIGGGYYGGKRKQEKPRPIPLRLAIAYGKKKKVITLSIWGKDRHKVQYVDYPLGLEAIIEAIQRIAHRIESNEL